MTKRIDNFFNMKFHDLFITWSICINLKFLLKDKRQIILYDIWLIWMKYLSFLNCNNINRISFKRIFYEKQVNP